LPDTKIVINAPAKINLFLDVLDRDKKSYHSILTVFQAISLFDTITITVQRSRVNRIVVNNRELQNRRNIVEDVLDIFKERYNINRKFTVKIEKRIPLGAGLAGGSSDAAAVICGINNILKLKLSGRELTNIAKEIGKDVPFFFHGSTQIGQGYGDRLKKIRTSLDYYILLIYPGFEISTKEGYRSLSARSFNKGNKEFKNMLRAFRSNDLFSMADSMYNVFEKNTFKKYPLLQDIKEDMIAGGAENALMSGSGSTVFGITRDKKNAQNINKKLKQKYKSAILLKPLNDGLLIM